MRDGDHAIAVLTREWSSRSSRQPGELERTYVGMFQRFASMIAEGSFPFQGPVADSSAAPRVGDGVMALDEEARVRFASPNAVSALHRVGIGANAVGMRLAELGFNDSPVRRAYETKLPVIEEFEQTSDVILLVRCMPVLATGVGHDSAVTGGLLLVRDVTEVRKRDKLLLSKDATIREIHHRVKNNLQTISSLLRLQGRRLNSEEAKAAVAESVRRIRTIALVHETLSREPGDDVAFLEIVRPLLRLAEEGLQSPDRPVRFTVQGEGGRLPSTMPRRCRWCSPNCCRTPSIMASPREVPAAMWWWCSTTTTACSRSASSTTVAAWSPASSSTRPLASACRSCARW